MTFLGDYHVHTPYCPHGSQDAWRAYIEKAISKGLTEISFTEHAPLPESFSDPVPLKDSAMNWSDLDDYLKQGHQLKNEYKHAMKINVGFEIDFIEDYEDQTRLFLDTYHPHIDDAILSVHMLKAPNQNYYCLDYSTENFKSMINSFGSIDQVYQAYYKTVLQSIEADLGTHKPTRIGHMTLVRKFQEKFPNQKIYIDLIESILNQIKRHDYQLDVNTAGLYKPDCLELYPSRSILQKAKEMDITLTPGSDAHESKNIARGFEHIMTFS
ncbi:histidinol-phosphatase (PHP family) [Pelagirhabdus alkalitolerans]|uniref:Histidinol-phosphatase n=1 Tax=Pelagirhabdus alkalitolerans TaxID=1612202 RepID=A0A1G6H6V8_9BACI|nr:histidinol-phosphatase HisJ [Pelagirhabdus alkalitolerans]SDB89883.1 histidinol-phosphatase (PHP family) [Pelagirhabdus alkalitolerans]